MCEKSKIISRVKNGEISICKGCKNYNFTFNNIFFQFNEHQLNSFRQYVFDIDVNYWLDYSSNTTQKRKIPVQTFHQNLVLIFDLYEINELKKLLEIPKNTKNKFLSPADVDYALVLN